MPDDEERKGKRRLEAPADAASLPSLTEIGRARKAELVALCEDFGLDPEGKVPELRERLRAYVAARTEEAADAAAPPSQVEGAEEEVEVVEAEEAPPHAARAKPELDPTARRMLRLRSRMSARRPRFRRQEWFRYRRLGTSWRKPRGQHSKLRKHLGYRGNVPSIGFRGPSAVRGLHPSGFEEVLVHRVADLEGVDPARQAVRIAHGVGTRKRIAIEEAAEERSIRVLNPLGVSR